MKKVSPLINFNLNYIQSHSLIAVLHINYILDICGVRESSTYKNLVYLKGRGWKYFRFGYCNISWFLCCCKLCIKVAYRIEC